MIHFAPVASILVPEYRQRTSMELEAVGELRLSIERNGLLHPLVVRAEGDSLFLVAGERRLTAITDLVDMGGRFRFGGQEVPEGEAPFVLLGELTALEAQEAEFEENVRRVDLDWRDRAKATAALAALRQAQADAGVRPTATAADLGEEVYGWRGQRPTESVRQQIVAAQHLADPDVRGAKSLKEATKILERKGQRERNQALAAVLGPEVVASRHSLVQGDCREWMLGQSDGGFDVVLTDPPYGVGADGFGDSGGMAAGAHEYVDDTESFLRLMNGFAAELFRLTKPEAWAFIFCDIDRFRFLRDEMEEAGWHVFRTPIVWHKPGGMRAPWPERGPQRKYELCLFANKGWPKVQSMGGDVIAANADENLGHGAQKPVALYAELLRRVVTPGMRVLDPFCGSGTVFEAAQAVKCAAVGVELDAAHYAVAAQRLQRLKEQE